MYRWKGNREAVTNDQTGATLRYVGNDRERDHADWWEYADPERSFRLLVKPEHGLRQAEAALPYEQRSKGQSYTEWSNGRVAWGRERKILHKEIIEVDPAIMPLSLSMAEDILRMLVFTTSQSPGLSRAFEVFTAGLSNQDPLNTSWRKKPPYLKIDQTGAFVVNESGEW